MEFLHEVIENMKAIASRNERPMLFTKSAEGQRAIAVLAVPVPEYPIAIYTVTMASHASEVVFVSDSTYSKSKEERGEAFLFYYFSKKEEKAMVLPYIVKKGNIVWQESMLSNTIVSGLNPFKISKEDLKKVLVLAELERIKNNGKKEVIELLHGFKLFVYRYKGKACFEIVSGEKKVNIRSKLYKDDKKLQKIINQTVAELGAEL